MALRDFLKRAQVKPAAAPPLRPAFEGDQTKWSPEERAILEKRAASVEPFYAPPPLPRFTDRQLAERRRIAAQQITTAFPLECGKQYRWHYRDGTAGQWTDAGANFAIWPAAAVQLELRDAVDPEKPAPLPAQNRPTPLPIASHGPEDPAKLEEARRNSGDE